MRELTAQNEKLTKDLDEEKSKCENNEDIASVCSPSKVYKHKYMFILWENANALKEEHKHQTEQERNEIEKRMTTVGMQHANVWRHREDDTQGMTTS